MPLILNIETATTVCSIALATDGEIISYKEQNEGYIHAENLTVFVEEVVAKSGFTFKDINAIAVSKGPGSYTGLRVGMASAKGLCFALKKPFITIGTLEVLTVSALQLFPNGNENQLYCPMIDARRMEVFTAMYKHDLTIFMQPYAMILDVNSFEKELLKNKILFFGSGSDKWKMTCKHENAIFEKVEILPKSLSISTNALFLEKKFTELAYSEPMYLKEFQSVIKK